MKLLILSTDKTLPSWSKLTEYKRQILKPLPSGFTLDTELVDTTPLVFSSGRISHYWLKKLIAPYFSDGYDIVGFHMSDLDRKRFKVKPSLRGSNPRSNGEYGDFYFWADEDSKRYGLSQFVQTFLHELSHEYHQQTKTKDLTHEYHKNYYNRDGKPDVSGYVKSLDWSAYQPKRRALKKKLSLLEEMILLYEKLQAIQPNELVHPVADYQDEVTQPYGVKNSLYPKTGRHVGTDYATPTGTPLVAPKDGVITEFGETPTLGKYCHFQYEHNGQTYTERYLHLNTKPTKRNYKQNDIIAKAGNTGLSTGAHLHQDIWVGDVDLNNINKDNWDKLTVNPQKHYA